MSTVPSKNGSPSLRLIVVGRADLDPSLRTDADVEVVRVPSPLEAIGELGEEGPARSAVIVGEDADPRREGEPRARDWMAALRQVDPGVRVLGMSGGGVYDATLEAGASGVEVRAAIDAREPLVESISGEVRVVGLADEGLARTLLQGGDVLSAALTLIRERVGAVEFHPPWEGGAGVLVEWRGKALGRLSGAPDGLLGPQATWLATWLALAEQHAQLREAAFTDALTGAWNRRYFERFLGSALAEAGRLRRSLTILMFDIDDFKKFNDAHGHAAGDLILRETVRLLSSVIRPSDKVCRIGGDEFAVIFHEPEGPRSASSRHPESVFEIARRFQKQVAAQRFPKLGLEAPGTLTISGGLATFPWDGRTPEDLVERCDRLMLESKAQGKNAITLGPGSMGTERRGG